MYSHEFLYCIGRGGEGRGFSVYPCVSLYVSLSVCNVTSPLHSLQVLSTSEIVLVCEAVSKRWVKLLHAHAFSVVVLAWELSIN